MRKAGAWLGMMFGVLACAPAAHALSIGTVRVDTKVVPDGGPFLVTAVYEGKLGDEDLIVTQPADRTYRFQARGLGSRITTDDPRCTADGSIAFCDVSGTDADSFGVTVLGGLGNDRLDATRLTHGRTRLEGGDGNDTLVGDAVLVGGGGADIMRGGAAGAAVVDYSDHQRGVTVRLDGGRNDGTPGENDWIQTGVTSVVGSLLGNDLLIGDAGPNRLTGSSNAATRSTIEGAGGDDTLTGYGRLVGGDGDDDLISNHQDGTHLVGGPGDDTLEAGNLWAEAETDCGEGVDVLYNDPFDATPQGCETIFGWDRVSGS